MAAVSVCLASLRSVAVIGRKPRRTGGISGKLVDGRRRQIDEPVIQRPPQLGKGGPVGDRRVPRDANEDFVDRQGIGLVFAGILRVEPFQAQARRPVSGRFMRRQPLAQLVGGPAGLLGGRGHLRQALKEFVEPLSISALAREPPHKLLAQSNGLGPLRLCFA